MSTTKQPPTPTDYCSRCGVLFFDANTANAHFKSNFHRWAHIDAAIAKVLPELRADCPGFAFPLNGRWWLD